MSKDSSDSEATFVNVDLSVRSTRPLDGLVKALGRTIVVMFVGREGRSYSAHLELAASGYGQSPDRIILRFVALIDRLPAAAKTTWSESSARTFDIGIRAGRATPPFHVSLRPATVEAIARIGATMAVTVYPPECCQTT
jgi:hypothetical protein